MLSVPPLLNELIGARRWPATEKDSLSQNLKPLALPERVRRIAQEETSIYLYAPPFHTVREHSKTVKSFWNWAKAAPSEIDFDLALVIGDFGLGSDAEILLDYRADASNPRVIRLRWPGEGSPNHWVVAAPDFKTFVEILGL